MRNCVLHYIHRNTNRTNKMVNATYNQADKSIAQYDAFVSSAVGQPWGETQARQATVLAFNAVDACQAAAADKSLNATTRAVYKQRASEMALCV